jgi:branched-chain amino acid transport system ATP-binding protein
VLRTRDLTVRFGGHVAVDAVTCEFPAGSLAAIVGPNGAGKTTFFNLISGQLAPSSGQVLLDGVDITRESPSRRARRGLGRGFQLTQLFARLTVTENVRLAAQARAARRIDLASIWSDHRDWRERAEELVAAVGLAAQRDRPAASLPHGDQRKLDVAMLIALDPRVYLFDEPTAGMSAAEVPAILDLLRALKRERNKAILLVEHKMDVVAELADRIVVLHNGRLIAAGDPASVIAQPAVQQAYLGGLAGPAGTSQAGANHGG